jgi:hypothetical protein
MNAVPLREMQFPPSVVLFHARNVLPTVVILEAQR